MSRLVSTRVDQSLKRRSSSSYMSDWQTTLQSPTTGWESMIGLPRYFTGSSGERLMFHASSTTWSSSNNWVEHPSVRGCEVCCSAWIIVRLPGPDLRA